MRSRPTHLIKLMIAIGAVAAAKVLRDRAVAANRERYAEVLAD